MISWVIDRVVAMRMHSQLEKAHRKLVRVGRRMVSAGQALVDDDPDELSRMLRASAAGCTELADEVDRIYRKGKR